jgi:hypothetical protein
MRKVGGKNRKSQFNQAIALISDLKEFISHECKQPSQSRAQLH